MGRGLLIQVMLILAALAGPGQAQSVQQRTSGDNNTVIDNINTQQTKGHPGSGGPAPDPSVHRHIDPAVT
jgi:hypothetical protein